MLKSRFRGIIVVMDQRKSKTVAVTDSRERLSRQVSQDRQEIARWQAATNALGKIATRMQDTAYRAQLLPPATDREQLNTVRLINEVPENNVIDATDRFHGRLGETVLHLAEPDLKPSSDQDDSIA